MFRASSTTWASSTALRAPSWWPSWWTARTMTGKPRGSRLTSHSWPIGALLPKEKGSGLGCPAPREKLAQRVFGPLALEQHAVHALADGHLDAGGAGQRHDAAARRDAFHHHR